jgi:hypothetical protein
MQLGYLKAGTCNEQVPARGSPLWDECDVAKNYSTQVPLRGGEWLGRISVGVAANTTATRCADDLIKVANEGLYLAKRQVRNRVAWMDGTEDLDKNIL